jgi:ABC-type antimicrobial peptide transport system permease subunit
MLSPMVLLTLILSTAGIYGLTAQTVAMRRRELGVRAALGADRRQLIGLIVRDGLRLARAGLVVGLAGIFVINRIVMSIFVDVTWAEPSVVALCGLLMIGVTLAASFQPAHRAARVDPMSALRQE